jgi:hypothetical protein
LCVGYYRFLCCLISTDVGVEGCHY